MTVRDFAVPSREAQKSPLGDLFFSPLVSAQVKKQREYYFFPDQHAACGTFEVPRSPSPHVRSRVLCVLVGFMPTAKVSSLPASPSLLLQYPNTQEKDNCYCYHRQCVCISSTLQVLSQPATVICAKWNMYTLHARFLHVWLRFVMLSRCSSTKYLPRSSVGKFIKRALLVG